MDVVRYLAAAPGLAALGWLWAKSPKERALVTCEVASVTCTCEPGANWGGIAASFACGVLLGGTVVVYYVRGAVSSSRLPSQPRGKITRD